MALYLPHLLNLHVTGPCDIFRIVQAAPNLQYLRTDFDCLNTLLNITATCELLQKRIVHLELVRIREVDWFHLNNCAQKLPNIRNLIVSLENPTVYIDSLILQILSLWADNLCSLCINGSLTPETDQNLCQWLINHSHLRQENSFFIENTRNRISLWLK